MDWVAPAGPVYQAGTLSANPVAMAAGLAMLEKLASANPYTSLAQKTDSLARRLEALSSEAGASAKRLKVQRVASLFWIVMEGAGETVRAIESIPGSQKELYAKLFHFLLGKGIYLAPSGFEVSFLSTAHTDRQTDALVEGVRSWLHQ
jgi:glutamate-1-semialdehyde 2,1-aminomutase